MTRRTHAHASAVADRYAMLASLLPNVQEYTPTYFLVWDLETYLEVSTLGYRNNSAAEQPRTSAGVI